MKRFLVVLMGVCGLAAAGSGAATAAPTGDTCTVSGSDTAYTIAIMLPANAPEQGVFAIRSNGHTVVKMDVSSNAGVFSTTSGPTGKSRAWVLNDSAVPGATVSAAVTTNTALTGKSTFIVTPGGIGGSVWYDAILCQFPRGTSVPSNSFTAQKNAIYKAKTGTWQESVTVPGSGRINFVHKTLATGGTPSPLIKAGAVTVKRAGKVTLTLRPTPAGMTALNNSGAIKLSLNIEYSPKNGKPANKIVALTLRK
jgi:hypothetical protein